MAYTRSLSIREISGPLSCSLYTLAFTLYPFHGGCHEGLFAPFARAG
jgi:hypothetical protein